MKKQLGKYWIFKAIPWWTRFLYCKKTERTGLVRSVNTTHSIEVLHKFAKLRNSAIMEESVRFCRGDSLYNSNVFFHNVGKLRNLAFVKDLYRGNEQYAFYRGLNTKPKENMNGRTYRDLRIRPFSCWVFRRFSSLLQLWCPMKKMGDWLYLPV